MAPAPAVSLAAAAAGARNAAMLTPTPAPPPADESGGAALRAMIGQMLIIGFPGTAPSEAWPSRIAGMIRAGEIGGVILFGYNIVTPGQLKTLNASLRAANPALPPFLCIDQEGGQIQRLTRAQGFVGLPSAKRVATMDQAAAYRFYRQSAQELADLGFNVNLGPVVDLDTYPENPAIGRKGRSYASDPKTVIAYAMQFIDAHEQAGVLTVAKHFPGHGSARKDPHREPVDIAATWSEDELDPFRTLIDDHFVDMVMVGHLYHPRFSDGFLPASLSKRAITGELRNLLGFQGLVITDDLDMGAVTGRYSVEAAAVLAIGAGADLLIVANRPEADADVAPRIVAAVSRAVEEGVIPRARIEESYRRIVAAKDKLAARRAYLGN